MMILITNLLWILYSTLEGFREGFYWHYKNTSRTEYKFEIHPYFTSQRAIILILIGVILYININWWSVLNIIGMSLIFSFFHNGSYYYTRNKLDHKLYPLKWMDQSTTSTAKMTKIMTFRNRTIFMFIGVLLQLVYTYL